MTSEAATANRVLVVSHETTISSSRVALLHLMRWLAATNWRVAFGAPNAGPISSLAGGDDIDVFLEPDFLQERGDGKLQALIARHDCVVADGLQAWRAMRAADAQNVPAIWLLHETAHAKALIDAQQEIAACFARARLLVAPTPNAAGIFHGATDRRFEIVPYGIPPTKDTGDTAASSKVRVLSLGSFEPRRGQDLLLDAIARLAPDVRAQTEFLLAGRNLDASFVAQLRSRAADLTNVEIADAVTHRNAMASLARSDLLVLASRAGGMPITVAEAFSVGTAVILTHSSGADEFVHDRLNALFVEPNSEVLASAIERCVRETHLRQDLAATARRTYERHFSIERAGTRWSELIRAAIDEPNTARVAAPKTYATWLAQYDDDRSSRGAMRRRLRALHRHPLISILLPVYNPDLRLLDEAIASVRDQLYEHWELCIADDASTDPAVRPFLESVAAAEPRVRLIFRDTNGHIAAASNSALTVAAGEWCALLDQDDLLSPQALAVLACEIEAHPHLRLLYSDEDKIDEDGVRSTPYFKTDWNPQLFLAQNFINHLGAYRTELLRGVGGFREGYEGSQDYDLALRCIEQLEPAQIRHIPRVLYHWRMAHGSVAARVGAKPYATIAARRAIADHLKRTNVRATVQPCPENAEAHRVAYDLPDPPPLVSVVIPTRNAVEMLQRCVDGLQHKTNYARLEIILVDNGSTEPGAVEFLRRLAANNEARVVDDHEPFNFSRLINRGASAATGEFLLLLNNDIEVEESGWLREMVSHAAQPRVGAVGARLWYPYGTIQHGGVVVGLGGVAGHASYRTPRGDPGYFGRAILQQNCTAVTGACLLVRKALFDEVGGFDAENLGISFNDVDFCLKLRARGHLNVWTPYANLVHHESASRGHNTTPEEQAQFVREAEFMQRKWRDALLRDPYYNPNLTLNWPGFDLAFPPRV